MLFKIVKKLRHYYFTQSLTSRSKAASRVPTLSNRARSKPALHYIHKHLINNTLRLFAINVLRPYSNTAQMGLQKSPYCIAREPILACKRAYIATLFGLNKKRQGHILRCNICPCAKYDYNEAIVSTTIRCDNPSKKALLASTLEQAKAGGWLSGES